MTIEAGHLHLVIEDWPLQDPVLSILLDQSYLVAHATPSQGCSNKAQNLAWGNTRKMVSRSIRLYLANPAVSILAKNYNISS